MAMLDIRKAPQRGAFFVFIACLLVLPALPVLADTCRLPEGALPVGSQRVIDGDTLELDDGRRLRLIGIDTPEIGRRGEPSEPFAQAARRRLQQLVGSGQLHMLPGVESRDSYGRTLAHLFDGDGNNLEAQLLAEGLGFALAVPPNLALIECHARAERQARKEGKGLWGGSPVLAVKALDSGGFQLIGGRITRVERAGGYLWLDMQGPLALRIAERDRHYFQGLDPQGWVGRDIEVRGWVIDRRGQARVKTTDKPFMLPLRHPRMLEFK